MIGRFVAYDPPSVSVVGGIRIQDPAMVRVRLGARAKARTYRRHADARRFVDRLLARGWSLVPLAVYVSL